MKKYQVLLLLILSMTFVFTLPNAYANDEQISQTKVIPSLTPERNAMQEDTINKMNEYRELLGLSPFKQNQLLQQASQAHTDYLAHNGGSGHDQKPNLPLFTGKEPWDRGNYFGYRHMIYSEIMSPRAYTASDGINSLFDAPYHRLSIIDAKLNEVGVGSHEKGYFVVNFGKQYQTEAEEQPEFTLYPYPGQKDAKTSWLAVEDPNPLTYWRITNEQLKVVGYPISFIYNGLGQLVIDDVHLTNKAGQSIATYNVTPKLEQWGNYAFIIPKEKLKLRDTYYVDVKAHIDDDGDIKDASKQWSFMTMEDTNLTNLSFTNKQLVPEINNINSFGYELTLTRDNQVYVSGNGYGQSMHRILTEGTYTLYLKMPGFLREATLPITLKEKSRPTDQGDNEPNWDWDIYYDNKSVDKKVTHWLFKDIKEGDAHYEGIKFMADNNIVNGSNGYFYPLRPAHRGHVAKMMVNALDLPLVNDAEMATILNQYEDVSLDDGYAAYIATATKAGIFKGSALPGSTKRIFKVKQLTTREQMATVLVRAFRLDAIKAPHVEMNVSNVSKDHRPNVQTLANLGITNQFADFGPHDQISRAALSTFLYRVMQLQK